MVDPWAVTGAVASVVAAGGVIWERAHYWRTRPHADVRIWVRKGRDLLASLQRDGSWLGRIKNWGTEDALGIELNGFNREVIMNRGTTDRLEPQSEVPFYVHFDDDDKDPDRAWILVSWSTPTSRDYRLAAWFPIIGDGDLAAVRGRQIDQPAVRRMIARWLLPRLPAPLSVPPAVCRPDRHNHQSKYPRTIRAACPAGGDDCSLGHYSRRLSRSL